MVKMLRLGIISPMISKDMYRTIKPTEGFPEIKVGKKRKHLSGFTAVTPMSLC
jgi:hypothetical protein